MSAAIAISLAAICYLAVFTVSSIPATTAALVVIGLCGMSYGLLMAHARAFMPPHLVGPRRHPDELLLDRRRRRRCSLRPAAVVTANAVPGEPAAAYSALFTFYAAMLGVALAIYLFSRDAKPEKH